MHKVLMIIALAVSLWLNSVSAYAQPIFESVNKPEIELDSDFIELMQTNPEQIYEKYDNVVNIEEISFDDVKVDECIEAYEYNEYGIIKELDCDVALNKIICRSAANKFDFGEENTSEIYVLTAKATSKTSDDSLEDKGVTLYGCIGWRDNFGLINNFEYASGSRSGAYSGNGYYQASVGTSVFCNGYFDSSFYSTSQKDDTTGTEFRLFIRTPSMEGTNVILEFATSIFD